MLLIGWSSQAALPLSVGLVNPTSGSAYFSVESVTIVAEAFAETIITNVQIFLGTNVIGDFTNTPCFVALTNLSSSTNAYSLSAIATDEFGQQATSTIVSVTVKPSATATASGPILNRQNGLFEQYVRILNVTAQSFPNGTRLFIANVNDGTNQVWRPTGTNSVGVPYIDAPAALSSGGIANLIVQYYVAGFSVPTPVLVAEPLPFSVPQPPRPVLAVSRREGIDMLTEFTTVSNRLYYTQSSSDLTHWITLPGLMFGTGDSVQRTNLITSTQFWRVLMLP